MGRKATRPGALVQIDTLFINIRPDKPIKHMTAYWPGRQMDGRARV